MPNFVHCQFGLQGASLRLIRYLLILTLLSAQAFSAEYSEQHISNELGEVESFENEPLIQNTTLGPFLSESGDGHVMQILNSGSAAFAKRIQMIERAEKSIDLEYFIYNADSAGRLFTQALVKQAKKGVKIRLLVDAAPVVMQMNEFFADEFRKSGIEVRYYNKVSAISPKGILYRDHRKIFSIDGVEAIIGGRNIADEYFDLSPKYNFLDREIFVMGPIVKKINETFEIYWNSKIVTKPNFKRIQEPKKPAYGENDLAMNQAYDQWVLKKKKAKEFFIQTSSDQTLLDSLLEVGSRNLENEAFGYCGKVVLATDRPGTKSNRVLWEHLKGLLDQTNSSLLADTPYFILKNKGAGFMKTLLDRKVQVKILTNSLISTDAFYTIPVFRDRIKGHIRNGAEFFTYEGSALPGANYLERIKNARWGVHSKTAIFDKVNFMVGTFNVDPRSKNLNTELAVFCYDSPYLAGVIEQDIYHRIDGGVRLNSNGDPESGKSMFKGASIPKRIMYYLFAPLAHIFDGLL